MIEIMPGLWVGDQNDFESLPENHDFAVVHACKDPYHRQLLGYKTLGAPKDHPEYLVARRNNVLYLNMIDVDDPKWVQPGVINPALDFIHEMLTNGTQVLVHCNKGESRAPSLGLMYVASSLNLHDSTMAIDEFKKSYPSYNPKNGIKQYMISNWNKWTPKG